MPMPDANIHSGSPISTRTGVLVAVLAVVIPFIARVMSSPLTVLLLSPLLLISVVLALLGSYIFLAHLLDSKQYKGRDELHSAARPFAFSTPAAWQVVMTRSQWSHRTSQSFPPLFPDSPAVSSALDDVLHLIVRDFVWTWYSELSASPSFPAAVSTILHDSLDRLINRTSTIDIPALVVKRILPKVTAHIDQFRQSEMALRGAGLERRLTQSEELDMLLASRYSSKGGDKLHSAIDNLSTTFTKQTEESHLKSLVDKALPFILSEKEGNSKVLKTVVREVVACAILYPIMDMIADPDFWNRLIDQIVSAWHIGLGLR
jgi:sorting nexin-25